MLSNEVRNTFFSELLRIGRLVSNEFETRDPATLLVDGDEWFNPRQISQVLDKLPKLQRRTTVASEKNLSSGLYLPENAGSLKIQLRSGQTNEQKLT